MSEGPIPVSTLREAVRRAVAASSTRAVGEAVGMTHRAVQQFMAGTNPHASTVRKLAAWYVRHAAETQELDADTATAAISLLVSGYPEVERELVRAGLMEVLREAHRKLGTDPPAWLADD